MAEKKNKGRFTLQFNPSNPQQSKVIKLLERQGRHKAQLLTNAVLHYIYCKETPDIVQSFHNGTNDNDDDDLEKRVLAIVRRYLSASKETVKEGPATEVLRDASGESDEQIFGPELSSAITNTLSAFCK